MSDERETRNAVFSAAAPGAPVQPQQNSNDDLLDIPVELAPLPSSGIVYPAGSAFSGKEAVEIKAMTAREEDILTSAALAKKGTILTELIRSCLIEKSVDPADLLVSDRYALLLTIRAVGYGTEYEEDVTCSECDVTKPRVFNLASFPIKRLDIEPVTPGSNLFSFTLPKSQKHIKFRFLTGRDEEDMHAVTERQKKLGMVFDTNITTTLIRSIVSVNDVSDKTRIARFVQNMPAQDSLALRKYMGDHQPGVLFRQQLTCPACGHVEEVNMPMGMGFLWPHAKG
jgi:hypothetical protein